MSERRFAAETVRPIAEDLVERLKPACERIEVAGSLRRGAPEVKDIEIVCQPVALLTKDLFGERVPTQLNGLDGVLAGLVEAGILEAGDKNGIRYKQFSVAPLDIKLDLFCVLPPAQWGVILAIRTGPAQFSKRLVTPRKYGGLMPSNLKVKDGAIWDEEMVVDTPDEFMVFDVIGEAWIEPGDRT